MTSKKLVIKALLNEGEEIRRFNFDLTANNSALFQNLKDYIIGLFKLPRSENISFCWKDSDGDLITFSSDEEFYESLESVQDDMLKIYIQYNRAGCPPSTPIHPNIICDGCQGTVAGNRYKCLQCDDYDLCHKCHLKAIHVHHDMILLRTPTSSMASLLRRGFRCTVPPGTGDQTANGGARKRSSAESTGEQPGFVTDLNKLGQSLQDWFGRMGIDVTYEVDPRPPNSTGNGNPPTSTSQSGLSAPTSLDPDLTPTPTARNSADINAPMDFSGGCPAMDTTTAIPTSLNDDFVLVNVPPTAPVGLPTLPPHIQQAYDQMVSMGFGQNDMRLRQLLIENNGDISRCLDIIQN